MYCAKQHVRKTNFEGVFQEILYHFSKSVCLVPTFNSNQYHKIPQKLCLLTVYDSVFLLESSLQAHVSFSTKKDMKI